MIALPDLVSAVASRSLRQEQILVERGQRALPRLLGWTAARFLGVMGLSFFVAGRLSGGVWTSAVTAAVLGALMALWALAPLRRALAYQHGWADGRLHALKALPEYESLEEWAAGVAVYDLVHVLGLPAEVPDDARDLEA